MLIPILLQSSGQKLHIVSLFAFHSFPFTAVRAGLKDTLLSAIKDAMRANDKERLSTLRLMSAEIKRIEVDTRQVLDEDDVAVIALFSKMVKQRQDSISAFARAGRDDLVAIEAAEIAIIQTFLPQPLTERKGKRISRRQFLMQTPLA